jgi:hypothetical protein
MAVITLSSGLVFQRILVKPQTLDQLVRIHKLRGGGDSYTRIVYTAEERPLFGHGGSKG